jgi:hypothetical protein
LFIKGRDLHTMNPSINLNRRVRTDLARTTRGKAILAGGLVVLLGLTSCGSGEEEVTLMPDVTGRQLDIALTDIKTAGFEEEVEVDGGGTFGIIDKSNWDVCKQSPAAGKPVKSAPLLTVDRSCDDESDSDSQSAEATTTTVGQAATEPSTPPEVPATPPVDEVLTAENNPEMAALLVGSDCDETVAAFADKYRGRTIAYDGIISSIANFEGYSSRYDMLVPAGSEDPNTTVGPNFKFENVDVNALKIAGLGAPTTVSEGDKFRFVARVGEFKPDSCLFFLTPISTEVR